MTIGELRKAIKEYPDEMPVGVLDHLANDYPIGDVYEIEHLQEEIIEGDHIVEIVTGPARRRGPYCSKHKPGECAGYEGHEEQGE